jgi:hypothetical protein
MCKFQSSQHCSKLLKRTAAKELVRRLPAADQLHTWVEEAKTLPRVIRY